MKKYRLLFLFSILLMTICSSCDKDNFDNYAPNATFFGDIKDVETGELVQQDVIMGSMIYYIEMGWNNNHLQAMNIKNDGTFRNNFMFAADYKVILNRGNFVPQDTIMLTLKKGDNQKAFEVLPYLRIYDESIVIDNGKAIAKFKLQQNTNDKVKEIALYAHNDVTVGEAIQRASVKVGLNDNVIDNHQYEIVMELANQGNLVPGKNYYFRIGAQSTASEAKHNYAPPVDLLVP